MKRAPAADVLCGRVSSPRRTLKLPEALLRFNVRVPLAVHIAAIGPWIFASGYE
jgi:hypothetical protein